MSIQFLLNRNVLNSLILCLVVTRVYHRSEDDSISEDGETSTELVLPEENGERHMKPVRMLRFSGI